MSLLDEAFENFTIIDKRTSPDGYGGTTTEYVDGATIQGAIVFDGSNQAKVAQAMGVTSLYTLTVRKNIVLDYHDVLRRDKDGQYFRLTTDSDDLKTPNSAGLDMRQYQAEEWILPTGGMIS